MGTDLAVVGNKNTLVKMTENTDLRKRVSAYLKSELDVQRHFAGILSAATKNPDIWRCTQESIYRCCIGLAELRLRAGTAMPEAHIVPFKNEAVLVPDYRGLAKIILRGGHVRSITCNVVCEGEVFKIVKGTQPTLHHEPGLTGTPEYQNIVGAYCFGLLADGTTTDPEWMTRDQIEQVRQRAPSRNSPAWNNNYSEMCRKTVMRRWSKRAPVGDEALAELDKAFEAEDAMDRDQPIMEHESTGIEPIDTTSPAALSERVEAATKPAEQEPEASEPSPEPPPQEPKKRGRPKAAKPAEPPTTAPPTPLEPLPLDRVDLTMVDVVISTRGAVTQIVQKDKVMTVSLRGEDGVTQRWAYWKKTRPEWLLDVNPDEPQEIVIYRGKVVELKGVGAGIVIEDWGCAKPGPTVIPQLPKVPDGPPDLREPEPIGGYVDWQFADLGNAPAGAKLRVMCRVSVCREIPGGDLSIQVYQGTASPRAFVQKGAKKPAWAIKDAACVLLLTKDATRPAFAVDNFEVAP